MADLRSGCRYIDHDLTSCYINLPGTRRWLRHYATSRKVTDSIPDEVTRFFSIYLILPASIRPLGWTQPRTEMSTRNLPKGKGWPTRKADLTAICEQIVLEKCGNLDASQSYWPPCPVTCIALPLPYVRLDCKVFRIHQTNILLLA
jgi:hypothetical protein